MGAEVSIPVWVLLLGWALGGLLIGSPWLNSKSASMTLVRPTPGEKLQLALGIVASGPIVCTLILGTYAAAVVAAVSRKLTRPNPPEQDEEKGGEGE